MVIRYPKYISNFRFFTIILSIFKISYCKLVELTLPHHLVLGNCLAHKQNYLYLCFLIFPQGILLICALLLFLSGSVFPRMLCNLFNICWQVCLKRFFFFFPPCHCFSLQGSFALVWHPGIHISGPILIFRRQRNFCPLRKLSSNPQVCSGPNSCCIDFSDAYLCHGQEFYSQLHF